MSLAIKYRPQTLEDVQGNADTIKSIRSILEREQEDIQHAWLFTGPSGCGKTTLGRIVAKELGCHENDYKEYDSADFRGIDSIREIRKIVGFAPTKGKARVFLLDECHKLTNDAQNALLKALEEPPKHVYFILCTTDPDKLLKTIRGRCVTFSVSTLPEKDMAEYLKTISRKERKRIAPEVLKQIAEDSMGGIRDALQILDKIIDLPAEEQAQAAKQQAEKQNQVIELCRALFSKKSWKEIASIVEGLEKEDAESIRYAVLGYCSSILKKGDNPKAYVVMDCFREPFYNTGKAGLLMACYEATQQI